jgi:hypothetical protein
MSPVVSSTNVVIAFDGPSGRLPLLRDWPSRVASSDYVILTTFTKSDVVKARLVPIVVEGKGPYPSTDIGKMIGGNLYELVVTRVVCSRSDLTPGASRRTHAP